MHVYMHVLELFWRFKRTPSPKVTQRPLGAVRPGPKTILAWPRPYALEPVVHQDAEPVSPEANARS